MQLLLCSWVFINKLWPMLLAPCFCYWDESFQLPAVLVFSLGEGYGVQEFRESKRETSAGVWSNAPAQLSAGSLQRLRSALRHGDRKEPAALAPRASWRADRIQIRRMLMLAIFLPEYVFQKDNTVELGRRNGQVVIAFFIGCGVLRNCIQNQARKLLGWDYLNAVLALKYAGGHLLCHWNVTLPVNLENSVGAIGIASTSWGA